jgi:hypothetical protein
MIDLALRFPDESTARQLLGDALNASRLTEDGGVALACFTATHALDIIGEIEGASGWHANLRLLADGAEAPAALAPYVVTPATPDRIWA